MTADLRVSAVTVSHWDELCTLFASSSGVNRCWCMWPVRPPGTHHPDEAKNKAAMRALLAAGESPGLIAVDRARAVGWCAVGPHERYPQYERSPDDACIWAIPCLYIAPGVDRAAIAKQLLDAAIDVASASGANTVLGPPPWWLPGDTAAIAAATGTFLANGFEITGPGARMPQLERAVK